MKRLSLVSLVCFLITFLSFLGNSYAANPKSANYEVNEVQFGSGGLLNGSSTNYSAQESLGNTGGGHLTSSHYQAYSGFLTPNVPFLSMTVGTTNANLGTLNSATASTGTGTFSVEAYVDSGYVVESVNNPPTQEDGHQMKDMTSATTSSPGTEQFGINLVQNLTTCANAAPANFGANPVQEPSNSYATGVAATGYNTCGLFKYNPGDTIAESTTSGWGDTNYTISYLLNINPYTAAGSYTLTENLVAVATF
jgi:hypothetical protein